MRFKFLPCFLIINFVFCSLGHSLAQKLATEADAWLKDLEVLETLARTQHAKPFWINKESDFELLFANAKEKLCKKQTTKEERVIELLKIIAFLRDGHSNLPANLRYNIFGYLPFTAAWFGKELHIIRALESYRQSLGAKIIKLDNTPIEEVVKKLRQVVPHANESRFRKFSPYYLHLPGLLYGLGILDRPNRATLVLQSNKGEFFDLKIQHQEEDKEEEMVDFGWDLKPLPLYRQKQDQAYWFEYLENEKILYLNYNRVISRKEENIWAFSERLFQFVEEHDIDKFIVDIRNNGGGNSALSASIWKGIESNAKINQRGKLFVITGYKTFSAAISFASYLELRTHAIFVGEGPCDYMNAPGDSEVFDLPHSGLKVALSKLFHEKSFYLDERSTLEPDYEVEVSFDDYSRGKDPVLQFIKAYKSSPTPEQSENTQKFTGRYEFSPFQYLDIKEGKAGLLMEITGQVYSPLYPVGVNLFSTEIKDFRLAFDKKAGVKVYYPDGKIRFLKKLDQSKPSPYELIYAEAYPELEKTLLQLKQGYPDIQFCKDHHLSSLALEVYYDVKDGLGRDKAREMAINILQIAIRINPEDNKFAKASLQYY